MKTHAFAAVFLILAASFAEAADFKVEPLKEAPPKDALSAELGQSLSPSGVKVTMDGQTYAEIWPAQTWAAKESFTPSFTVLYPFEPGALMGAVRFPKKVTDFREQEIEAGVYTLRYSLQPQDGNHIGTSDTRDFFMLLPAKKDTDPGVMDPMKAQELSAEVPDSTHPAILTMLGAFDKPEELPAVRHDEERELWSVLLTGKTKSGETTKEQVIEFVIEGHAVE